MMTLMVIAMTMVHGGNDDVRVSVLVFVVVTNSNDDDKDDDDGDNDKSGISGSDVGRQ